MAKQTKITKSARGEECQVRLPGICNHNPDTVVLAHLNGGGMGLKNPDYMAAYACSECHDYIDQRKTTGEYNLTYSKIKLYHLEGVMRTQKILVDKGLLVIK